MRRQLLRMIGWLSLGLTLVLGTSTTSSQEPRSYEFHLRGGGFNQGQILTKMGHSPTSVRLLVRFKFGTWSAGQGLELGQGSWLDRGMRPNEPMLIKGDIPKILAIQVAQSLRQDPNAYWSFWIYNTTEGYFQITRPPTPLGNTKVPDVIVFDDDFNDPVGASVQ
jgi:hypothetical protein